MNILLLMALSLPTAQAAPAIDDELVETLPRTVKEDLTEQAEVIAELDQRIETQRVEVETARAMVGEDKEGIRDARGESADAADALAATKAAGKTQVQLARQAIEAAELELDAAEEAEKVAKQKRKLAKTEGDAEAIRLAGVALIEAKQDRTEKKQLLADRKQDLKAAKKDSAKATDASKDELAEARAQIEAAKAEREAARTMLAYQRTRLAELEAERAVLGAKLDAAKALALADKGEEIEIEPYSDAITKAEAALVKATGARKAAAVPAGMPIELPTDAPAAEAPPEEAPAEEATAEEVATDATDAADEDATE